MEDLALNQIITAKIMSAPVYDEGSSALPAILETDDVDINQEILDKKFADRRFHARSTVPQKVIAITLRAIAFKRIQGGILFKKCREGGRV